MEAKDLMVEDWVSVSGTPMQVACIGTTKVGFKDEKGGIFFHLYEEVKPIPLTAEILKKNGYDYNDSLAEWATDSFCIDFGHELFEDEPDYLFVWVGNCHVVLQYAHELQHTLRLCGIEKEIEMLRKEDGTWKIQY